MTGNADYRPDIDGLRAIAVGTVVLHHAFPQWLRGGFVGVDIFFVISGYLITRILLDDLQQRRFSLRQFYARRVKRIFPALALVLIAVLAFGWFALLAQEYRSLGKHVFAGAAFFANLTYWAEIAYFDAVAETKPLLHLWSLGIEEQFYIFWPLLLAAVWRKKQWLYPLTWALLAGSFGLCLWASFNAPAAAFYAPPARAWELAVGAILAFGASAPQRNFGLSGELTAQTRDILSVFGLCAIFVALIFLTPLSVFPGFWAVLPVLGAAALIAAGPNAVVNRHMLARRPMVWLGLISYPLYLWHWPLLSYGRIVTSGQLLPMDALICIGLAVVLAALTMILIERPIRRSAHPVAVWGPLAAVCTAALLGATIFALNGAPNRATIAGYLDNRLDLIRTPATDAACLETLQAPALMDYCRFSNLGLPKTVAIIGDSHAHVTFPGLALLAQQKGMNALLLANSSCPPLLGQPIGETSASREKCGARITQIVETIAKRSDIDLVFITTRGPIYATGTEPVTANQPVLSQLLPYDAFRAGLAATANRLRAAQKTVIYITENPELSERAESCLIRPLRLKPRDCRPLRSDVEMRQQAYIAAVSGIDGLTTLHSLNLFCPDQKCQISAQGALLYADSDHLSEAGSHFLAQNLLQEWLR